MFGALKAYFRPVGEQPPAAAAAPVEHRRFLSDNPMVYAQAVANAEAYVSRLAPGVVRWLQTKPYDPAPGNAQYFRLMHDLLNILQAMQLPPRARVLEIGSGPGWVTEVLLMLGHEVDALEPATDMIAVARERCAGLGRHFNADVLDRVRFHKATVEEIAFADRSFDAVLYFDVLHHVVDEHVAMAKTFRFLKPDGCIAVVESAWHPDFKELEASLIQEMKEFGTLENPYSTQYLDQLLAGAGFDAIKRYVGVNGFFGAEQLDQPLRRFGPPLHAVNNVVARRPATPDDPAGCDSLRFRTDARYTLVSGAVDARTHEAALTVAISNCGETLMDNRSEEKTHVTLALRRGAVGSAQFIEAKQRHALPMPLKPGQSVTMDVRFTLPADAPPDGWELDAIAETFYWFSSRGIAGLPVPAGNAEARA